MIYSRFIGRAAEVACIAHNGQYRKNPTRQIPYVSHVMMVGIILQRAGYGDDVVVAGLLHDVLEDTDYPREQIINEFGESVVEWIEHVTEHDKSLPWEARKEQYLRQLRHAPPESLAIAVADKIHNMHSILVAVEQGEAIWGQFTRGPEQTLGYLRAVLEIAESRMSGPLMDEYRELVDLVAISSSR